MAPIVLCVDIGNSGLRVARLRTAPDRASALSAPLPAQGSTTSPSTLEPPRTIPPWPFHEPIVRLDWSHAADNASPQVDGAEGNSANYSGEASDRLARYAPESPDWSAALAARLAAQLEVPGESAPVHWYVSSVQRGAEARLREFATRRGDSHYHLVTRQDLPLDVDVRYPERVGVDRLLAAVAAAEFTAHRPLIVIQAGSAITVDWLVAPYRFAGGAIMPGVPMMLRLLGQAADLLPHVAAGELIDLPRLPGKETSAAMACGVSSAVVGGIQHLIQRYRELAQCEQLPGPLIVLSGGDGPRLAKHLPSPLLEVQQLVLRGLALLAQARS
jgi:type III pantothenate kinase